MGEELGIYILEGKLETMKIGTSPGHDRRTVEMVNFMGKEESNLLLDFCNKRGKNFFFIISTD